MKYLLHDSGYVFEQHKKIWLRTDYASIHYSDGDETELRIAGIIDQTSDLTVLSTELRQHCTDWPSLYHLSGARANILRPFASLLSGDILEIGAGCGAITRYLGESGAKVLALEGSLRRAAIARARTGDLDNVTVLAERFDDFKCGQQFNVITLIGVLEYANLFTSGENAPLVMLERVRSLLKPGGRLIIAIENQLGLKYFAGALEDHLGQAMYGIEGRYRKDQPQTFGRKVLADILNQAGFTTTEFLAPFPDYKRPVSIVTEEGFAARDFDAAAFAWQSVQRDSQLPEYSDFSLELAWPELFKNGLALDVANSFLIVASSDNCRIEKNVLAYHYSTERVSRYCKETRFVKTDSGSIEVLYLPLFGARDYEPADQSSVIGFHCPHSVHYSKGKTLSWEFVQIVTRDGWTIEEVGQFIKRYVALLEILASQTGQKIFLTQLDVCLSGKFFDYVPQNIIILADGLPEVIDSEWFLDRDIALGQLLLRAMWTLGLTVTTFGRNATGEHFSQVEFIQRAISSAGFMLTKKEFTDFVEFESLVQEQTTGCSKCDYFVNWSNQLLPLNNFTQAIAARDKKISMYHQTVIGRDKHIADLNRVITGCGEHIVSLNQIVREHGNYIAKLNQIVVDRDSIINQVFSSVSWRLTRPLRVIKPFLKNIFLGKAEAEGHHSVSNDLLPTFDSECVNWNLMLSASAEKSVPRRVLQNVVDVIIPVYRGLEQTRRCIISVLQSTVASPFRLIVINDASPEAEITTYLRGLSSFQHVILVENTENLGFTATVNRGMNWSDTNDVVLLNSDTEVANDWLDKLKVQAYSDLMVGSVTPFSNNATICNYPTLDGMRALPDGENVRSLDATFASANKGRNIEIPTAVGFCMYIRRDCLNEVGLFDVETFGKGYGEENDFCLRATAKGWKHLLAADTFVFHEGEVSFQEGSNPRKERAMNILRERYPMYETEIARHIAKNEAYPLRVAATAARFRQGALPVVLHVMHAHGGGTEKHIEELCRNLQGKAKLLIMTPPFVEKGKNALQLRAVEPTGVLAIHLPMDSTLDFLVSLFQSFGVSLAHIHHVLGYSFNLRYLIEKLGVPFYLTIHDYMLICPRINLMPIGQRYCGEPEPGQCSRCLLVDCPDGVGDIIWWREIHAWFFNTASVVICPSHDVAQRCQRYYPDAVYRVVAHEKALCDGYHDIDVPVLNESEPLRVAILGALARHKGIELIAEVLLVAEKSNVPLQFQLIGYAEGNLPIVPNILFSQTGHYLDVELADKINTFNPHLILFPASCPETYSYTLTAAMKSKRPVMVTNLGALPERAALRPWTWLIDWNISAVQLVDKLCEVRDKNFLMRKAPVVFPKLEIKKSVVIEDSEFYENGYLSIDKNVGVRKNSDIRKPGKITVLVLLENVGTQPSPCAYIRLILPLIRERGEKLDLLWVAPENVTSYVADVLICQRTAVTSVVAIDTIITHCQENNIRIVYDLDDLLLALPEEHPEHAIYAPKAAAVFRWLLEADEVWVSTEDLRHHILQLNPRAYVIPNYIDDTLWIRSTISAVNCERNDDTVRLLYMGTQTHCVDFELVTKALKRLKNEFLDRIEISLIGITANADADQLYTVIVPPQGIGANYPAFVSWIINSQTFDIGIAPLVDNKFNRCKSAMKFLDYSALGMVTVASDLNGYALIRNGENGFKVKNTEDSWYEMLKTLIVDVKLRKHVQNNAFNDVFEKYGYGSVAGYRTNLLTSLVSEDIKKVVNSVLLRNEVRDL
jgi:GT2 family glycosyltransferase/glycosyltransferase involved in cell wall biosynthesis/SAM-dependent methyltransferase